MTTIAERQTTVIQVFQAMFGAAPGVSFLAAGNAYLAANPSVSGLALALSGTPAFFGTTYSETLSSEKFATAFVTDLIGARATAADKSALVAVLVGRMAAGATQSAVIGELTGLLATVPSGNSSWGVAATWYNTTVATKIIDNLLGSSAATASKLAIVDAVISLMAAGVGVGRVVELLVTALDGCSHTDATWGAAATLFDNRVDVARYYSVDKAGAATMTNASHEMA